MHLKDYSGWEPLAEEELKAEAIIAKEQNSPDAQCFEKILLAGAVFKFAGLTPIFVYNNDTAKVAVYAEEYNMRKILIN